MKRWFPALRKAMRLATAVGIVALFGQWVAGAAPNPSSETVSIPDAALGEPRVKLVTTAEGIYQVGFQQLLPYLGRMGDPRGWSLWVAGQQVPMLVHGEADGQFNPGDYIQWYAPALRTPYNRVVHGSFDNDSRVTVRDAYTTEAAYFLRLAPVPPGPPLRIHDVPTTVPLKNRFWKNRTFRRLRRFEYDLIRRNLKADPGAEYSDNKFWDYFSWPSRPYRNHYRALIGLAPDSDEPCSVTFKLWGMNQPRNPPEHQTRIGINNVEIGRASWRGVREFYFTTTTLSPSLFKEWATQFFLEALPRQPPDQPDMMLLDWIEVSYPSVYRAEDDWLAFVGPPLATDLPAPYQGWLNPLSLETFMHQPVWILDVTAGERHQPPLAREWRYKGKDFYNVFLPIAKTDHRYVAYTPGSVRTPAAVRWAPPDRLRAQKQGADYLIITHEKFAGEAQRLAEHRSALGLKSVVVTTDEIANSFHEGFSNIVAIKAFIRHAWANWTPRPRYLLLVGDASWDDLGIQGSEYANYLPTYYYRSPHLGFYASDNWFACMDDDEYPDLAVGRLPVRSVEEARAYIYKVIEYDTRPAEGPWRQSVLLVSSYGTNSDVQLDEMAESYLKGMKIVRCYTTAEMTRSDAQASSVTRQFDQGHSLVVFAGHGGSFVWQVGTNVGGIQARDLFSPRHVAQLTNWRRYPLVLALTCYTNSFDNPMQQTIGESLILEPGRGAIAVVSASWRGDLRNEFPLAWALLARLRADPNLTIGEALATAKRSDRRTENTHGVCILGDPAVRIYFDDRPSNRPSR